jgi:acyl carrier protein
MDKSEIRAAVLTTIKGIAPEIDENELQRDQPLRDQVDLDSMDWLNVIIGLHGRLRVDIPESDYAKLTTLDAIVEYLAAKLS